jgi:hypothetical protein
MPAGGVAHAEEARSVSDTGDWTSPERLREERGVGDVAVLAKFRRIDLECIGTARDG